jgi:hypothetical protein
MNTTKATIDAAITLNETALSEEFSSSGSRVAGEYVDQDAALTCMSIVLQDTDAFLDLTQAIQDTWPLVNW